MGRAVSGAVKLPLRMPASHTRVPEVKSGICSQLPANSRPGREQVMTQVLATHVQDPY